MLFDLGRSGAADGGGDLRGRRERTATHRAGGDARSRVWYVLASVPLTNSFDFDQITGATGCSPAEVVQQPVPGVTIVGRTAPCTRSSVATLSTTPDRTPGFFDVAVTLVDPEPDWWNETGMDGAPALIAGYQIVYTTGAEPTTSSYTIGGYRPVREPGNARRALGVVPRGTSVPVTVALPDLGVGTRYWLATRIVYVDSTENPLGPFDPAAGTPASPVGPQITTEVSGHCGPVLGRGRIVSPPINPGTVGTGGPTAP